MYAYSHALTTLQPILFFIRCFSPYSSSFLQHLSPSIFLSSASLLVKLSSVQHFLPPACLSVCLYFLQHLSPSAFFSLHHLSGSSASDLSFPQYLFFSIRSLAPFSFCSSVSSSASPSSVLYIFSLPFSSSIYLIYHFLTYIFVITFFRRLSLVSL